MKTKISVLLLGLAVLIGLLGASPAAVVAQTPEPQRLPEATLVMETLQAPLSPAASSSAEVPPKGTDGPLVEAATPEDTGEGGETEPAATRVLEGIVEPRTPLPTVTPGWIAEEIEQFTAQAGLAETIVLGLRPADWINLGISLLMVLAGYLLGTWLIRRILPRLARRTQTDFDDTFLTQSGPKLRWLVALFVLDLATLRLTFLHSGFKIVLLDIYYVLGLFLSVRILWQMIALAEQRYTARTVASGRSEELAPLITLLVRVGRVAIAVIGSVVLLSRFGVNVAALTALLGLGGLAFSLAARDTIADAIAGFIILVDRPFRIGDRIEIQGVGTWGDVTDIGLRTTRIRTRDNRMVIVPNSVIGSNQVVNYTYPDPRYRIETHVGIAYGTDIETARQVIIEAVRSIEAVLPDRPVEALYNEMGDAAMIFRVRWWIESYVDTRRVIDQVHTALQYALDKAGFEPPLPAHNVNLRLRTGLIEDAERSPTGIDDQPAPRSE